MSKLDSHRDNQFTAIATKPVQQSRNKRVYAFIDSQNLNVSVQKFGWKMDWRKLRKFLADQYGVTEAFMFIGYVPENETLYEQMHDAGYMVVLKPTFDTSRPRAESTETEATADPEDKKPVKGNIDADLVLWTMKEIQNYDQAIIVSGDGDFFSLVEFLEQRGKLKNLLTPTGYYSQLYHRYESYIVRLDRFRRQLAYHDRHKRRDT